MFVDAVKSITLVMVEISEVATGDFSLFRNRNVIEVRQAGFPLCVHACSYVRLCVRA